MAQTKSYDISKDEKNGELVFNGIVTFDDLYNEPTFTWFRSDGETYKPDAASITYLAGHLEDFKMVIFMGTWCDDSHYLLPRLEKILEMAGKHMSPPLMYGTDRAKTTKGGEHTQFNITLVPTVILMKDGKEAGRITETVQNSVEADLAAIIRNAK